MKWFRFAIQKYYFDMGYSSSHYLFKAAAVVGIAAAEAQATLIFAILYGIFCYGLGRFMYRSGFLEAETEVRNKIDPFVKEMRQRNA